MTDIEHRIAAHREADPRRHVPGRSSTWDWEVPLKQHLHAEESFETIRDNVAAELHRSPWFALHGQKDGDLFEIWDELKDAEDVDHFNLVLDALYDLADHERAWIS